MSCRASRAGHVLLKMLRTISVPSARAAQALADELADPFAEPQQPGHVAATRRAELAARFKMILWGVLAGPLVRAGFFAGFVSAFVLGPMLAVLWRQRKYMADATAVRLTRVAPARVPLRTLLIATPLCVILGALVAMLLALLVYLSLAVSLLVTGTSVGLVHVVLRWLGS